MNNYPKHVGDFIRDTVGLSMLEEGAYNRLLDQYYARETPLPLDKQTLYRMARCTSAPERKAVDYVLAQYFTKQDDGWHQKRVDQELVKYRERSASAAASAQQRWSKRNANAMRTHPERIENASLPHGPPQSVGNASQKPEANSQTEAPLSQGVEVDRREGPPPPNDGERADGPKGVDLPPKLRRETWDLWLQHRREKGAVVAPSEHALTLVRLAEYDDPNEAITAAITAGLRRIDPPEKYRKQSKADQRAETARVLFGAGANSGREQDERDITGESQRVA